MHRNPFSDTPSHNDWLVKYNLPLKVSPSLIQFWHQRFFINDGICITYYSRNNDRNISAHGVLQTKNERGLLCDPTTFRNHWSVPKVTERRNKIQSMFTRNYFVCSITILRALFYDILM